MFSRRTVFVAFRDAPGLRATGLLWDVPTDAASQWVHRFPGTSHIRQSQSMLMRTVPFSGVFSHGLEFSALMCVPPQWLPDPPDRAQIVFRADFQLSRLHWRGFPALAPADGYGKIQAARHSCSRLRAWPEARLQ